MNEDKSMTGLKHGNIIYSKKETYKGIYKGITFEIVRWYMGWNFHIYLHTDRFSSEFKEKMEVEKHIDDKGRINYRYENNSVVNSLDFHCGVTYYEILNNNANYETIKIGCDYMHLYDDNHKYNVAHIIEDVIVAVDSFLNLCPDYKHWCNGNGKLYNKEDGFFTHEGFNSFEYYTNPLNFGFMSEVKEVPAWVLIEVEKPENKIQFENWKVRAK